MKKNIFPIICMLSCGIVFAQAQESSAAAEDIIRGFMADTLSGKAELLQNTDIPDSVAAFVLDFAVRYYPHIAHDPAAVRIALAAVNGLQMPSDSAAEQLRDLYRLCSESEVRAAVLRKLALISRHSGSAADFTAECLKNELEKPEKDVLLIAGAVQSLSSYNSDQAFMLIFSCCMQNISPAVTDAAEKSLIFMMASRKAAVITLMENAAFDEKLALFHLVLKNNEISVNFKAEIAEKALAAAIIYAESTGEYSEAAARLALESVNMLREQSWTRAAKLVVKYFPFARADYEAARMTTEELINIVQCLGSLASAESGQTLAAYLAALNSQAEQTGKYDEQLVLAVIKSIGVLGEKSAFDYLLYAVSFSAYSSEIIAAARDSIAELKW
ncbi:MAG: hypothetical protein NC041_04760 [Bacteroides sp.]|nr:hypothetical protein [Prevotella sp.]MCM1407270.1 hypothetical protein [Treponema brennaborense]MCM1469758.1 hypothetical protein [Bacteroides sp.]